MSNKTKQIGSRPDRTKTSIGEPPQPTPNRDVYRDAVTQAFYEPVISVQALAAALSGGDEAEQEGVVAGLTDLYPAGKVSMAEAMREVEIHQSWRSNPPTSPEGVARMRAATDAYRSANTLMETESDVLAALSGDTWKDQMDPATAQMANGLRNLVDEHSPGGRFAQYGGRSEAEDAAIRSQLGDDANYTLTKAGEENHRALAVSQLMKAADDDYAPAAGMSQAFRAVGGTAAPYIDAVRNVTTEPGVAKGARWGQAHSEMLRMAEPDGKYAHAADMWNRSRSEVNTPQEQRVFNQENLPKYDNYDVTNYTGGLSANNYNTSFPLARGYNNMSFVREAPTLIGDAMQGGGISWPAVAEARDKYNRITPITPAGMSDERFQIVGKYLGRSDTAMEGYIPSKYGPMESDAFNAVSVPLQKAVGVKDPYVHPRGLMSSFGTALLETFGEMASDPINVVMNVATGPVAGAVGGASSGSLIRGLRGGAKTMLTRQSDDFLEEGMENAAAGVPLSGGSVKSYFSALPPSQNLLVPNGDPNTPGYDDRAERATMDALDTRRGVSSAMQEARRKQNEGKPYGVLAPGMPRHAGMH